MDKNNSSRENRTLKGEHYSELAELVEALTHSGLKSLDATKLKNVKSICKTSNKNVEQLYHLIVHQLERNHSEIRFSAFQLCDEIFRQSHCFRELVINNLKHILELTVELNPELPLPLPRNTALNLKKLTLTKVSEWCKKYGHNYKKLVLGFNYLKQCKKVDFSALQLQSEAERAREEEKERRLQAINKERVKKVEIEVNEFSLDISATVKSLTNGLDLLLPKPEEFFISLDNKEHTKVSVATELDNSNEILKDVKKPVKEECNTMKTEDVIDSGSDEDAEDCEDASDGYTALREFGALNTKHSIEIQLKLDEMNCLKQTAENEIVIENVRDQVKLISNNYLPRVKGWLQILTKASGCADLTKRIINLKTTMETALEKYGRLNIKSSEDDCVSTDSELEEVKDIDSVNIQANINKTKAGSNIKKVDDKSEWSILSKEEKPEDPTTVQARLLSYEKHKSKNKSKVIETSNKSEILQEPKPSTSNEIDYAVPSTSKGPDNEQLVDRKSKLLAVAPKLPFDIDLYHWEDEKLKAPTLLPTSIDTNKFWYSVSGDDIMEVAVPEGSSSLRTRVIEFVGEFKPVTKSCRAPLPNGKLCPRKDRLKCPFHGIIVPRDITGKCVNPEDEERIQAAEEQKKVPDWQDPELLKDIEKATGIDLKIPEKKGKGKRKKAKKYPGLTDIKAKQNTTRNRLSKKLFNKASVKRVAETLDNIDHRKFRDKFGDQFNYLHSTS